MDDLISRQDAIKAIKEKAKRIKNEDTLNGLSGAVGILFDLPSVKPQEKTGHWIWQTEDIYQCSECGEDIHVKEVMNEPQYAWCPMCGCPMEIER